MKNIDEVKALALAVIDEFLKRHGFAEGKHAQPTPPRRAAHTGEVTPTESPLQRHGFGRSPMTPRAMAERGGRHSGPSVVSPVNLSLRKEVRGAPQADMRNGKRPREALDDEEEPITPKRSRPAENVTDYGQVASNGSMEWLEELISVCLCAGANLTISDRERDHANPIAVAGPLSLSLHLKRDFLQVEACRPRLKTVWTTTLRVGMTQL
jgi:hypothetical protein